MGRALGMLLVSAVLAGSLASSAQATAPAVGAAPGATPAVAYAFPRLAFVRGGHVWTISTTRGGLPDPGTGPRRSGVAGRGTEISTTGRVVATIRGSGHHAYVEGYEIGTARSWVFRTPDDRISNAPLALLGFSTGGHFLAIQTRAGVEIITALSGAELAGRLTGAHGASWTEDSYRLVFVVGSGASSRLEFWRPNDPPNGTVVPTDLRDVADPVWGPRLIAFAHRGQVWVAAREATDPRPLTHVTGTSTGRLIPRFWSSDGRELVAYDQGPHGGHYVVIQLSTGDTSGAYRVLGVPVTPFAVGHDGEVLAAFGNGPTVPADRRDQLVTANSAGGDPQPLAEEATQPSWDL